MTEVPVDSDKSIAVFFSHGTTLASWESGGLLDREVDYYRRFLEHVGNVTFITYDSPSSQLDRLAGRVAPVKVLCNPWRMHYRLFGLLAPFIHYKALRRCTLVKTNQLRGAWVGLIAKWVVRKPLVVRCGYVWSQFSIRQGAGSLKSKVILAIEGLVARHADMVFVATEDDREYMLRKHRISEDRLFVLPNPIDTERFKPLPEVHKQPGLITYVGRLAPQKNLHMLVKAIMNTPEATLRLIGSGSEEPTLRSLATGCERVEFMGTVPNNDMPRLLNTSEIFVLPSNYEGSPKALLEAMACGLPVIGTDVPGIREVIQHNVNGLLGEPNENHIASAILGLLSDSEARRRLGHQARQDVLEKHSQSGVAKREAQLIQRMLEGALA